MKKILAIILACLMTVSLLPASILAADGADVACPGKGEIHNATNCAATEYKVVEPICDNWGYTVYECDACGDHYADDFINPEDSDHTWVLDEENSVAADCDKETDGVDHFVCSVCGEEKDVDVEWKHDLELVSETGAGCAKVTVEKCKVCGDEVTTKATDEGHKWSEVPSAILEAPYWEEDGTAVNGLAEYTCTVCGDTKEVVIFCEHDHKSEIVVEYKAPTCTETGIYEVWQCEICKNYFGSMVVKAESDKEEDTTAPDYTWMFENIEDAIVIPALGHDLPVNEDGTPNLDKYEEIPNKCQAKCACGREGCDYVDVVDLEHTDFYLVVEVDPTCTKYGHDVYACNNCGYIVTTPKEPTGHDIKTVTVPSTCTVYGYTFTYCANDNCDVYECVESLTADMVDEDDLKNYIKFSDKDAAEYGDVAYDVTIPELDEDGKETGVRLPVHLVSVTDLTALDADWHKAADEDATAADRHLRETTIQEPTCIAKGIVFRDCVYCGYNEYDVVDALGHKFADKYDAENEFIDHDTYTAPTCTEAGGFKAYCENDCGEWMYVNLEATGHDFVIAYEDYDCEAGYSYQPEDENVLYRGYKYYVCSVCQDEKVEYYSPVAEALPPVFESLEDAEKVHGYGDTYYDADGNVIEDESEWNVDISEGEIYNAPTCTEVGYQSYYCYNCDSSFLVIIEALGHDYSVEKEAYEAPTCTESGKKALKVCSRCEAVDPKNDGSEIAPLGHKAGKQTDRMKYKAPTCTATGMEAYWICERNGCGMLFYDAACKNPVKDVNKDGVIDTEDLIIKALGHDIVEVEEVAPTCETNGYVAYEYCTRCNYTTKPADEADCIIPRLRHFYDDGESAILLLDHNIVGCDCGDCFDCESYAYAHHICDLCGYEYIDVYSEAEGHKNAKGETIIASCIDTTEDRHCVVCGKDIDNSHPEETFEVVKVPATCIEYGYTLYHCPVCKYTEVVEDEIKEYGPHDYESVEYVHPDFAHAGYVVLECTYCGDSFTIDETDEEYGEEFAAIEGGLEYVVTTDVEESTDGAYINVTVSIDSIGVDVWGLEFGLCYMPSVTKLVSYEFVSENFNYAHKANCESVFSVVDSETEEEFVVLEGLHVAANAKENVTVDGAQAIIKATFKVENLYDAPIAPFFVMGSEDMMLKPYAIDDIDVVENYIEGVAVAEDGTVVPCNYYGCCDMCCNVAIVDMLLFLDVDRDYEVATMLDALALYNIILGEADFTSTADANFDGVIGVDDLVILYDVIVGATTVNEILGREEVELPFFVVD